MRKYNYDNCEEVKYFKTLSKDEQKQIHTYIKEYLNTTEVSLPKLAEQMHALIKINILDRKKAKRLADYLGYPPKDKALVRIAREIKLQDTRNNARNEFIQTLINKTFSEEYTSKQFAEDWKTHSFTFFKQNHGLSQYQTEALLDHFGVNKNRKLTKTWRDALSDFKKAGYTEKDISDHIFVEHNTISSTEKWMSEIIGWQVGDKRFDNMRKALDIKLTKKQVANRQGAKSRDEKQAAFDRLARSEYTVESLANEYENNLSMTKSEVLDIINAPLTDNEPEFTERWLARYIDPIITDVRKGHVSREELNFRTTFQALYPKLTVKASDHTVLSGNRELDMYIPELNLAIEFNGDYWHSDNFFLENYGITADEYHQVKFDECKEAGIQLLFVWESAWTTHKQVILRAINDFIQHNRVSKALTLLSNENNELDLIIEKELNYYSKLGKLTDNKVFLSNIRQRKDEYLKVV